MTRRTLKTALWLIVLASLIPGLILAFARMRAEGGERTVTLLMDEQALLEQALYYGLTPFELGERYRTFGLNGVALYEETLNTLAQKGRVVLLTPAEAQTLALAAGADIPPSSTLVTELEPGALAFALANNTPPAQRLTVAGRTWYALSGASGLRPAGPDLAAIARWHEAGWDLAYRPLNFPGLVGVGADFPAEARYLVHQGLEVAGHPGALAETAAASGSYLTGMIEGTLQYGMSRLSAEVPTARLFGIGQDWQNILKPREVAGKYLLAAGERGATLLYLRPYTQERVGDMVENTEVLIAALVAGLQQEGFGIGPVGVLDYRTVPLLRLLSAAGVLAGLGLLALMYPGLWGPAVAAGVLVLGVLAGGPSWSALALVAALVFPVIGYGLLPERVNTLGVATLVSLSGAVLLAAVGSDREALLGITPFAGVAATLVVPPALFLFHYALRYRRPVHWLTDFWRHPIRLGDALLVLGCVAALALVVIRRGNFPIVGASGLELMVRTWLSEWFVRPRFKELVGHPLALLGLSNEGWPAPLRALLLTGGVIAQASILNSFSHYHTPLLISLARTLIALTIGLTVGLVLLPLARVAASSGKRWLRSANDGRLERV
ncbi:DUF5693 family protein [soil metagenome]